MGEKRMNENASVAQVAVKGGFHLFWGLVVSTVIMSIGTIFIANLLGEANYGLYTIALAAPALIMTFRDWGVNMALTKYSSQYNAENNQVQIRRIFVAGILFETVLGSVLAVVAFLLSGFLATIYSLPEIAPMIQIAALTILTSAFITTAQAAFIGLERMELNSITLVIQAILKTAIIIGLVIFGLGPLGATIGTVSATLIAGLIAITLMWTMYRKIPNPDKHPLEIRKTLEKMLHYGLPLSIDSIISMFQSQFYIFLLPIFVAPDLIGNYGIATTFVVIITFFATPVSTMLFPAFSKLNPKKDEKMFKNFFQFSVKYASLLVVPAAAMVIALSKPGISVLFPNFTAAPLFLSMLSISYIYIAFGTASASNLINGQGQTRFTLKLALLDFSIGFPLGILLISHFGVVGLIATTLTSGIPSLIISLNWIKKHYGVTVDWSSSVKILLSAALASVATYALTLLIHNNWLALLVGAITFLIIFILCIIIIKAVNENDLLTIRESTLTSGPIRRLVIFVLRIVERLMMSIQTSS
jgi:O-antigen/teichoic acid export membrane protein